jgi:hypothetical protein
VNDAALRERENDHRTALLHEHQALEQRFLMRLARGSWSADVWLSSGGRPARTHLIEALGEHQRLLVTGDRCTGKSALAAFLLSQSARRDVGFGDHAPFAVVVRRLAGSTLDEETLARLNPAAGIDVIRTALEAGRGLVVVDGIDEAPSPDELKRSLAALAARYPYSRFVATTRPLPAKVAGRSESAIDGFLTVPIAGPRKEAGATVLAIHPRPPAERVAQLAAEVGSLLDRWCIQDLPPGSVLRSLTARGRFLLVCHLAASAYDARQVEHTIDLFIRDLAAELGTARWFPDTEQLLHEDEHPNGGEPIADPEALARRLVADIRAHPGILFERRPGVFAFTSLAVQQYLTAAFFAKERLWSELLLACEDPWWHPIIVLASGLPAPFSSASPPRLLIRELLRQWATADSVATFLAAAAAEVADDLPPSIRREIDRRLRAALPLRSDIQVVHIVDDIGEIAAPALIRALDGAGPDERARMLTALGRLDHPDAIRTIARFTGDPERTTEPILCWAWNVDAVGVGQPVGFFAFAAFFNLALSTPAASALFDQVLARTSEETRAAFVELVVSKFLDDFHWGAEPEEERDPWRSATLMEKILAAGVGPPPK